jgi:creatinine amidohydrolase
MTSGILSEMTIDEVRKFKPQVVVLGVASTEPHGPALPYGTDFYQCDAVCRQAVILANRKKSRALMYPTLPIGNNVNFKAFPFACRIRVRTLMLMVLDIIEALEEDGVRKIVLVNGHGGNTDTLHAVVREHFDRTDKKRRAFVCIASGFPAGKEKGIIEHPSDHGGESETSQIMYLRPELVKKKKLQNLPFGRPLIALDGVYYVRPWHKHVPLGGGGETRKSSATKGKILLETTASGLADFLVKLAKAPWRPDFPYPKR